MDGRTRRLITVVALIAMIAAVVVASLVTR
jgi:hypothetical protein